ncbi:MAG TPA: Gfo/Idh/MocA family oxidoreductase, partial [Candidatus Hydrogenedentes bacterium]|nr:Gfo/Idh/MocA family oxidoreductase [Candidatus Hydrogenedentota bacterium]
MNLKMNRRHFISGTLAAGAGLALPNIIPGRAFGQDGAVAPSNRITLGCIGVGGMGTDNMKNFLKLPDCQVVAVCDAYADRRQRAKEIVDAQYGDAGCALYGDFREVLARDDIDAVMIAA